MTLASWSISRLASNEINSAPSLALGRPNQSDEFLSGAGLW